MAGKDALASCSRWKESRFSEQPDRLWNTGIVCTDLRRHWILPWRPCSPGDLGHLAFRGKEILGRESSEPGEPTYQKPTAQTLCAKAGLTLKMKLAERLFSLLFVPNMPALHFEFVLYLKALFCAWILPGTKQEGLLYGSPVGHPASSPSRNMLKMLC